MVAGLIMHVGKRDFSSAVAELLVCCLRDELQQQQQQQR